MSHSPRIAFMGTPDFAVPSLKALSAAGFEIVCVYTQPPAPRGRGQTLKPTPVHAAAEALGLAVRTPVSMKARDAIEAFAALDLDLAVVVAYGQILVREVLEAPRFGCFNLHASLLPRWRGAAPIQRAIMAGDARTGAQIMRMSEGLDEGPVLASTETAIGPDDTSGALHGRLAEAGAALWPGVVRSILAGSAVETPQTEEGAVYARKIKPQEARIDWAEPAAVVDCKIRGLSPFPGAWCEIETSRGVQRLKLLGSHRHEGATSGAPGEVLAVDTEGVLVAATGGAVRLTRLQREGKAAGEALEIARGLSLQPGMRLL
jgi:methionyl-tRNA formyltransferase